MEEKLFDAGIKVAESFATSRDTWLGAGLFCFLFFWIKYPNIKLFFRDIILTLADGIRHEHTAQRLLDSEKENRKLMLSVELLTKKIEELTVQQAELKVENRELKRQVELTNVLLEKLTNTQKYDR